MGDDGTEPWRRREGETAKAHAAFLLYVELGYGQRSLSKVGEKSGKSRGYERVLQRWSSKHEWVARADAYDAHMHRIMIAGRERQLEIAMQRWVDGAGELAESAMDDALTDNVDLDSADPALVRERRVAREYILGSLGLSPKSAGRAQSAEGDGAGRSVTVTLEF